MMKKIGFTLAEVLITLAIIGVVAALITPSLVSAYQKTKVGPSIRKFKSTIEIANEHILGANSAGTISYITTDTATYLQELSKYLSGAIARKTESADEEEPSQDDTQQSKNESTILSIADLTLQPMNYKGGADNAPSGNDYLIYNFNNKDAFAISFYDTETISTNKTSAQGSYKGAVARVYYDINGFDTKPNRLGKDIFVYDLDNSGSVVPIGGTQEYNAYSTTEEKQAWNGSDICNETGVATGQSCAGSVTDNNGKVIYKY